MIAARRPEHSGLDKIIAAQMGMSVDQYHEYVVLKAQVLENKPREHQPSDQAEQRETLPVTAGESDTQAQPRWFRITYRVIDALTGPDPARWWSAGVSNAVLTTELLIVVWTDERMWWLLLAAWVQVASSFGLCVGRFVGRWLARRSVE